MNKKLLGAVASIVAVLGLIGGGTFAAWSDFNIIQEEAGAGILALNVGEDATLSQEPLNMAPGENGFRTYYLASNDGDSVPDGHLTAVLRDFVNYENGCSTNSEAMAEGVGEAAAGSGNYDPAVACGGPEAGEFANQARFQMRWTNPVPEGTDCTTLVDSTGSADNDYDYATPSAALAGLQNNVLALTQAGDPLEPGEGICVRFNFSLANYAPTNTTNLVQGDSLDFNIRFDLSQA